MITLVKDTIDNKDIDRLVDWLKTYPRLTKGPVTLEFEEKYSNWLGRKYSVFCNSGSSANLLAFQCLINPYRKKRLKRGDEVLIPSICWSTSLWPIIQHGLKPIFVDIDLKNLNIDLDKLKKDN